MCHNYLSQNVFLTVIIIIIVLILTVIFVITLTLSINLCRFYLGEVLLHIPK